MRGVGWSVAPREEAPGASLRATPPFSSGLESPIGGSLQARACLAFAILLEGRWRVSVETCCRSPVVVRPAQRPCGAGRHCPRLPEETADLAPAIGRAGPVRSLRTNPPPGEFSSVRALLWHRGHEGLWSPAHFGAGARSPDKSGVRRPVCGKARCGGRASVPGGSPKRTWLTGVSLGPPKWAHDPPEWTAGPAGAGPWVVRRSGPSGPPERTSGTPAGRSILVRPFGRQTDLNHEESSRSASDTVPKPIPRGLRSRFVE